MLAGTMSPTNYDVNKEYVEPEVITVAEMGDLRTIQKVIEVKEGYSIKIVRIGDNYHINIEESTTDPFVPLNDGRSFSIPVKYAAEIVKAINKDLKTTSEW